MAKPLGMANHPLVGSDTDIQISEATSPKKLTIIRPTKTLSPGRSCGWVCIHYPADCSQMDLPLLAWRFSYSCAQGPWNSPFNPFSTVDPRYSDRLAEDTDPCRRPLQWAEDPSARSRAINPAIRYPSMGSRGGNQPSPSSLSPILPSRGPPSSPSSLVSRTVSGRRYNLVGVNGIESPRRRGSAVARTEYPKVSAMFLGSNREVFESFMRAAQ